MNEDKLKFIYDNIKDVIWTWDLQECKYTYVSPAVFDLRGYTAEEIMEETLESGLTEESKEIVRKVGASLLENFNPKHSETVFVEELEQFTKSGGTVWIEVSATLVPDENGNPKELIGVSRNITERKKSRLAIHESERRYRELTDLLPQPVYELDINGDISFINKAGLEMFGDTANFGNGFDYFIPEESQIMHENRLCIMSGQTTGQEFTVKRDDGGEIPVMIYSAPIIHNEELCGMRGIIVDISERKKMENALKQSEVKYRNLISGLQEGLFVIRDGVFTFLNTSIVKIVGYEIEELIGKSFLEVIADERKEEVLHKYMKRLQGETESVEYETLLLKKDGITKVPAILSITMGEFDGELAIIGTAKDISYRINAEQVIKEREKRLNAIFQAARVGILLLNPDGVLIDCNNRFLEQFGYKLSELNTINFTDYTYCEDIPSSKKLFDAALNGEIDNYSIEKRYVRKDGSVFWADLSANVIKNDEGKTEALVAIIFDLSERKQIEEELKLAQEKLQKDLQKETIRSQFETLKNQVNPHFLFNSLNVLTSLIKFEPDLAEIFTERLSKVYRYVLENKDKDIVTLSSELDFVASYAFLLQIRFKNKLKIEINLAEDKLNCLLPTLALQMLIENAIKHNAFSKRLPLVISIYFEDEYLVIKNNYRPRDSALMSTGVGLKNLSNRYAYLTEKTCSFGIHNHDYIAKIPLLCKILNTELD